MLKAGDASSSESADVSSGSDQRFLWICLAGIVLVAGVAALIPVMSHLGAPNKAARKHVLEGTIQLPAFTAAGSVCGGLNAMQLIDMKANESQPCPEGPGGGYDDIKDGTQVTVSDSSGKVLAIGELTGGEVVGGFDVVWDFEVRGIPARPMYQVEVAHRGALNYSKSDLRDSGWYVALSLGD